MPVADTDANTEQQRRDRALLCETVRAAGDLAHQMFQTDLDTWTKAGSSPVSEADIAVDKLIRERLQSVTPDYGWLSEESVDDKIRLTRQRTWIVDPIDGTRSYLEGRPDWCVCVALVENERPVLAAVFAPVTNEFFFAAVGEGATCNGKPIRANEGRTLVFPRIAGPKPMVEQIAGRTDGNITLHPRIGSLALRLCFVADGRIDIGLAGGRSKDWDLAAADLIVNEANGKMTTTTGEPILYNRSDVTHGLLVAAGGQRHADIISKFRNYA